MNMGKAEERFQLTMRPACQGPAEEIAYLWQSMKLYLDELSFKPDIHM
jgi:hypothetical protein